MKISKRRLRQYRGTGRSRGYGWRLSATLIVALIVLVLLARGPLSGLVWYVLGPVEAAGAVVLDHIQFLAAPFTSKTSLIAENATLKAELSEARADAANDTLLAEENRQLKNQLGHFDTQGTKTLAYVVARPPQLPYDTLELGVGTSTDIVRDDIVATGGQAIGYISDIDQRYARVVLFSSPGQRTAAILGTVPLVVVGDGAGSLSIKVPQSVLVAVGDPVALAAQRDLLIGVVEAIETENGAAYKTLHFAAPVSLFSLDTVEVWKQKFSADIPKNFLASSTLPN